MKISVLYFCALSICVTTGMLAGCGGSQPPIGAPGAMQQTPTNATHADRGASWMLPGTSSGNDLVYAADPAGALWVISYPQGQLVGVVDLPFEWHAGGICSDSRGDVFVPMGPYGETVEYAHGGTTPIAILSDGGGDPWSCSVDPTTGNLAVATINWDSEQDDSVAVYAGAQGDPTYYYGAYVYFCGYDNQGNLFVDGSPFAELLSGGQSLIKIKLPHYLGGGQVQWDGTYMTVASGSASKIYRLKISGSTGRVVGKSHLIGINAREETESWIQGSTIIAPIGHSDVEHRVGFWNYPSGGKASMVVDLGSHHDPEAVTVSVGSNR